MRSLKEVREYLNTVGISSDSIGAVYGFLYAEGDFALGDSLEYVETEKSFKDFIDWYEDEEDESSEEEMDGGVFNDEAILNDYIFDSADKIFVYLKTIKDLSEIELQNNSPECMNLLRIKEYLTKSALFLDEMTKEMLSMNEKLNKINEDKIDFNDDTL